MKDKSDLPKLTIADFKASDLQAFPSEHLDPVFFQELRADFTSAGYRSVLNETERQEQEAYFERNWPQERDKAMAALQQTLTDAPLLQAIPLAAGRVLELREGSYIDADNLHMREHELYSIPGLAIDRRAHSDFRMACFADKPTEPIGTIL